MPAINRFAEFHEEIAAWRQDLHAHPELMFEVHRTAGIVEERLRSFGVDEIATGIGKTGVVAVIKGRQTESGRVIGLRADMDALPIQELPDLPYKSKYDGRMHACGHDGHTAMLLGAAKYLAETRNFDGTAVIIFQPAEEGGGGGREMVKDGMMERFGMHNQPTMPPGKFAIRKGGMLAAVDFFDINVKGRGGHAARPNEVVDPAIVVSQLLQSFQTIVSRNADPVKGIVVSVTQIHMGDANNVIPQTATMGGTVRTLDPAMRDLAEQRMSAICEHTGAAFGAEVALDYTRLYPATINHDSETDFAASVAREIVGPENVDAETPPVMGGEDFSFMLESRPGAFIFIGQGGPAGLHNPSYNFNDEIIPLGCSYWVRLVETAMPLRD
jgi:amidohydrolase